MNGESLKAFEVLPNRLLMSVTSHQQPVPLSFSRSAGYMRTYPDYFRHKSQKQS